MSTLLFSSFGVSCLPQTSHVVLDGCACAVMLSILYPLAVQGFADERKQLFALTCITHLAASSLALIEGMISYDQIGGASTSISAFGAPAALDIVSVVLLVATLPIRDRANPPQRVPHTIVCGMFLAVLPAAVAGATFLWHGSLAVMRFAYALSLSMLLSVRSTARELDLATRESEVALRQTHMLADQMRPHFIFNALSTIQGLCYEDPEAAATQVEQFSDYLRGHIDVLAENGLVPFETEIGHAREYASLSRAGSSTPFELVWNLRETAFMVPSLTIQPIVENAIRYGALARPDGRGEVRVMSERRGDFVRVVITDNGPGMDVRGKRQGDRRGIGLANAKERLEAQCDGTLTVSSSEQGTKVVVVVPLSCDSRHDKRWRKEGALS